MARIVVFAEMDDGVLNGAALELVTRARALGEVHAVALGPGALTAASRLGEHGAKVVHVSEDSAYASSLAEPATDALASVVKGLDPDLVLFSFTADSRDVGGRLAARLGVGAVSNAAKLDQEGDAFVATIPYFGGAKLAACRMRRRPGIVLLRPKSYEASPSGGSAEVLHLGPASGRGRAEIVERVVEAGQRASLEGAAVVVSGGRGLGSAENYSLVQELADALGGAAGASRAIVDAGWVPYSYQIGQTGKTVAPSLYLAAGISGAMQHLVGMKGSKTIIAINKDPEAPIFKIADLGVVGDVVKILPALSAAVRARRAGGVPRG